MKYAWVAVAVLCLAVSGVYAQTARFDGMGRAGIAVANDAIAWYQNPAGLSDFAGKGTNHQAEFNYGEDRGVGGSDNWWAVDVSGSFAKGWGWGAGFEDYSDGQFYGAGIGFALHNSPLSVGVNFERDEWDYEMASASSQGDTTIINAGLLWRIKDQLRLGARVNDLTEEWGDMSFDAGLWWPFHQKAALAVDLLNVFQANYGDIEFNAGIEYQIDEKWTGRIGTTEGDEGHDLTAGIGYKTGDWKIDAAWMDNEANNNWIIGVGKAL